MAGGSTRWRGRSVISKVVSLLDAFSPDVAELSLGELSQTTGLPMSTTYRLACELVAWGGLERADGGGYRVGMRMWELGALAGRGRTLRDVALPIMADLYEATHESVHLAVRDGHEALYVDTIAGHDAVPVVSRRGQRLPLHATGVGKVLLAHGPPELLADLVEAGLVRYTPRTIVAPGAPAPHIGRGTSHRPGLCPGGDDARDALGRRTGARRRRHGRRRARRRAPLGPPRSEPARAAVRTAAISISRGLREQARLGGPLAAPAARQTP